MRTASRLPLFCVVAKKLVQATPPPSLLQPNEGKEETTASLMVRRGGAGFTVLIH
jgi:hypothetical protein